jgi:sRNA-binding carbon storage regulator CsrA
MFFVSRQVDDGLVIDGDIVVTVVDIHRDGVTLSVRFPDGDEATHTVRCAQENSSTDADTSTAAGRPDRRTGRTDSDPRSPAGSSHRPAPVC